MTPTGGRCEERKMICSDCLRDVYYVEPYTKKNGHKLQLCGRCFNLRLNMEKERQALRGK